MRIPREQSARPSSDQLAARKTTLAAKRAKVSARSSAIACLERASARLAVDQHVAFEVARRDATSQQIQQRRFACSVEHREALQLQPIHDSAPDPDGPMIASSEPGITKPLTFESSRFCTGLVARIRPVCPGSYMQRFIS